MKITPDELARLLEATQRQPPEVAEIEAELRTLAPSNYPEIIHLLLVVGAVQP
jgi:hypothetical protein